MIALEPTEIDPPAVQQSTLPSLRELARRGVFKKRELRAEFERLISNYTHRYYRLVDGDGQVHFLADAGILLPLINWLQKYPKLSCAVHFLPPRKLMVTSNRTSVAALNDADVLSISSLHVLDGAMFLHVYDETETRGVCKSRALTAPMRDVNFGDMTDAYRGYCSGEPACTISRNPIKPPKPDNIAKGDLGPIDVVYTWVDSNDPVWQARFAKYVGKPTETTHASELRYLSRNELRYSLRSVLKYAPWVRNIYIVTDNQRPQWLIESDRVKLVDHRDIFPDPSVLPVFNSHAIESCLHRIPGLAERYIYFNDDVFLGRPVSPADFFGPRGEVKLNFSAKLSFSPEYVAKGTLPTDAAFRSTIRVIEARFGMTPIAKVLHTPHPMRKSVLEQIENEHPEEIARTRAARIRSETDLNVTGNLAYYYCLGLGLADWPVQSQGYYTYIDTGRLADIKKLPRLLSRRPSFFCLNLTHNDEVPLQRQAQLLSLMFRILFPKRGCHERGRIAGLFRRGSR